MLDSIGCFAQPRYDREVCEGFDQAAMHRPVKFIAVSGKGVISRQYDAVGQLGIMHDCPTDGQPSHSRA